MKTAYLGAALAAACLAGGALVGTARAAGHSVAVAEACASGYHTDGQGNCQPNIAEANRYCPPGQVFHPSFDGWFCDSPAGRTYYN